MRVDGCRRIVTTRLQGRWISLPVCLDSGINKWLRLFVLTVVGLVGIGGVARAGGPWPARRPPVPPPPSHQLIDVGNWPDEIALPSPIDPARFKEALAYVCRRAGSTKRAPEVLAAAKEAGVDPFLLGALMSERSRCNPRFRGKAGIGVLALQPGLYLGKDAPPLPSTKRDWRRASLLDPTKNLNLGARLLRMWQELHHALDSAFGGAPHRSGVSHFYWGDKVSSSGSEDLVLTTRRRLLARYHGLEGAFRDGPVGMSLVPPLEAWPRVATSAPGDDRDGGARRHRGLDVVASPGEPVRSVAEGTVIFAGANLRANARHNQVPPARSARLARRRLGVGGIYVCIRHRADAPKSPGVVSCYMHLEKYEVTAGQEVAAGEIVGYAGRTGIKRSPPHLHFELRVGDRAVNPWRYFKDVIIPPRQTLTHRYTARRMKARRRQSAAVGKVRAAPES